MDEHFTRGRKITLSLYILMGVYVIPNCLLSPKIGMAGTLAFGGFWFISLVFMAYVMHNSDLYGLVMVVSASILGTSLYIATGSIYAMMNVFLLQCLGSIFFMSERAVPITAIVQITSLSLMMFYPLGVVPDKDKLLSYVFSVISVVAAAIFSKKLISILNLEVEQNRRNAQERAELLRELGERYEESQHALNAKSEFMANMSHEIRTPINTIMGINEIASRECEQPSLFEYFSNISKASQNLLAIINDVLDISKIEAGKLTINARPYELREILNNAARTGAIKASEKKLDFSLYVAPDTPAFFIGDEVRISQVATNIINNALKYTNEGSVKVHVYADHLLGNEYMIYIVVSDTGIGIHEEDMEKLFKNFQRLDIDKNRSVEGTGLGLSLAMQIVKAMNGDITVDSKYGEGSAFTISFPQQRHGSDVIGEYDMSSYRQINPNNRYKSLFIAPKAKILIVDDNKMNLAVATKLLKFTQIQVTPCMSGKECLEEMRKTHYDLIFLDHMMPEMDGIETLHKAKRMDHNLCEDTPVIALTANAIAGSREKYIYEGFDGYLSKPIIPADFESIILNFLPAGLVETLGRDNGLPENDSPSDKDAKAEAVEMPLNEGDAAAAMIDHNVGINYCGGMKDMYIEILKAFVDEMQSNLDAISKAYDAADWAAYRITAHSLKSTSKTIGAVNFSEQAKEMEFLAADGKADEIISRHANFIWQYNLLVSEAAEILK